VPDDRTPDGGIVNIYCDTIPGLTVDLATEHVILDGTDGGYGGERSGPALATHRSRWHDRIPPPAFAIGTPRAPYHAGLVII